MAASSTAASTGGAGGAEPAECHTDADCPGEATECGRPACSDGGHCGIHFEAEGTVLAAQAEGDCRERRCDGHTSAPAEVADSADLPDDGNHCTVDSCSGLNPLHLPAEAGAVCSQDGGKFCDGDLKCVDCNVDSDCGDPSHAWCDEVKVCHCDATPAQDPFCPAGWKMHTCGGSVGPAACKQYLQTTDWCCPE